MEPGPLTQISTRSGGSPPRIGGLRGALPLALLLALVATSCAAPRVAVRPEAPAVAASVWTERVVADGVVWRYRHADDATGATQSVSLLDCDLARPGVTVRFAAAEHGREKTSEIAARSRSVAAVNGGYFGGRGEPVGLLKIGGRILSESREAPHGAIGVDAAQRVRIAANPPAGWDDVTDAIAAGPILVEDGRVAVGDGFGHIKARHPRTAAGLTATGHLILVAVDGRTPEAAGMTCEELARLMIDQGCRDAMNLDGGGSTTMWVRGEPDGGVCNFPCDDRRFDHAGERPVANAVLIYAGEGAVPGRE